MSGEKCPICGKGRLVAKTTEFTATVNDYSGRAHDIRVPGVLLWREVARYVQYQLR